MTDWINKHTALAVGLVLAALGIGFYLLNHHKGQTAGPAVEDKSGRGHF